jgi:hypothetical protein
MPRIKKEDLTVELVLEHLDYDWRSGKLYWKKPMKSKPLGTEAGNIQNKGHRLLRLLGIPIMAHHLVWFIEHGYWPKMVDHGDGNKLNNLVTNLRACNHQLNGQNRRKAQSNNCSGFLGVRKRPKNKWVSGIRHEGRDFYLGTFDTPEEAHQAYVAAKRKLHEFNTL